MKWENSSIFDVFLFYFGCILVRVLVIFYNEVILIKKLGDLHDGL